MSEPIVKLPKDLPAALSIVGEGITILLSNSESSGYELFIQEGSEGSGPPPHSHAWDESFYVIAGNIEFGYGEGKMTASPGTLVHIPSGTVHWFHFCAGGGKMFSVTGQNSNAANFFADLANAIPTGEPDIERIKIVGERDGVKFVFRQQEGL
jgi:quercetin dioxygenase-like cupin family protein